jgi:hypothetical protein
MWVSVTASVCMGLGSAVLVVAMTAGNGMILAAPVGLWTFVMALPVSVPAGMQSRSRKGLSVFVRRGARQKYLWNWRVWCTLGVWGCSIAVLGPRVLSALPINDRDIAAAITQADALVASSNLEEALDRYRQIDVPPALPKRNAQKWHNMGVVLLRLERYKEADAALRQTLQFDPSDTGAKDVLRQLEKDGF